MKRVPIIFGLLIAFLVVSVTSAADYIYEMQHGSTLSVNCDYEISVQSQSRSEVVLYCATIQPSATPAPTVTPTAVPTATPTVVPTATPTPVPTATPTPAPTSTPPPSGAIVGYGASTVGGTGGTVINVSSLAALRSALNQTGKRIINLPAARQTWDLAGSTLMISKPNVTLNGGGVIFKGDAIKVTTSQVILNNVTSHPGDVTGFADDVDAFTINGNKACISNIVLNRVEGLWGPDVGGIAILGCVRDMTVQDSIFGEGLLRSKHSESGGPQGHGLAFNISDDVGPTMFASRITVYHTLITTSQSRQPRVIGATCADFINDVFYNFAEGPQGNPQSLNLIGDTWKKGPAPAAAGLPFTSLLWRYQPDANVFNKRLDATTFIGGQSVIGYTPATPTGNDAAVLTSSPKCAPSVVAQSAAAGYASVLADAGPRPMSDQTQRLLDNLANTTGLYYNGTGKPGPNPTWP